MMATSTSAREASKAINELLHYCPEDQEGLLDVLDEYFTSPDDLDASIELDTTGILYTLDLKQLIRGIEHTEHT